MARVLIIGSGPFPTLTQLKTGFPQLRLLQFSRALLNANHDVGIISLVKSKTRLLPVIDPSTPIPHWETVEERLDLIQGVVERFKPDAIVSAGPHLPAKIAATVSNDTPLWVDIPGDPFAEAQARHQVSGTPSYQGQLNAYMDALLHGDMFSTASNVQRFAILGQLGILGRLENASLNQTWAHSIPLSWDSFLIPEAKPKSLKFGQKLIIAIAGGFNTWLDVDTVFYGLEKALLNGNCAAVITGGAIEGHHTKGFNHFLQLVKKSKVKDQIEILGWVPTQDLAKVLLKAHVLINADLPGLEAELGSRNRLLFALHQGLVPISTSGSELSRDLRDLGALISFPNGDPNSLAEILINMAQKGFSTPDREQIRQKYSSESVSKPLTDWVASPKKAFKSNNQLISQLEELGKLKNELKSVYSSPTWRYLSKIHKTLLKLKRTK